jgi:lysine 2,3-aminomutase
VSLPELERRGLIPADDLTAVRRVAERYSVAVTREVLDLIDAADPRDPIAAQFVPQPAEQVTTAEERSDPIGDDVHTPIKGITHRYSDRVLLKPLHVCPVYCRFCFRREVVGPTGGLLSPDELDGALAYIAARPAIWEVILTGGDPLLLSPRRLADLQRRIGAIPHVRVVRLHTRVPVVDSARVTDELVATLRGPKTTWLVLHSNHVRELTPAAESAIARLVDAGVPVLSQSVLLRGVNDDVEALEALFRRLVELRVKPYYLHHGDLAPGTAAFRTTLDEGRDLIDELRRRASGLCQPSYVLDIPGGHGKVPAGRARVEGPHEDGTYTALDRGGRAHRYPPG